MKKLNILIGTLILSAGLAGCSSSYYASSGMPTTICTLCTIKRPSPASSGRCRSPQGRGRGAPRRVGGEDRRSAGFGAENGYYDESSSNPYNDILADTYESAYARRLRGFESPTYRMPSSYYNFRYGSSFTYATAYDPAFYNIIISGDEVWVEPKYITSMFGTWGGTPYGGWYFGWNYSPSWWGYPSYAWGGWNWGFGFTCTIRGGVPDGIPTGDPVGGPDGAAAGMDITMRDTGPATITAIPADAAGATLPAGALRGRGTATEVMPAVRAAAAATAPTVPATAAATATVRSAAARAAAVTTTGAAVTTTAATAITAVRGAISTAARGMTSTAVRAAAATTTAAFEQRQQLQQRRFAGRQLRGRLQRRRLARRQFGRRRTRVMGSR